MTDSNVGRCDILLIEDNPSGVELTLRALRRNNLVCGLHVVRDGAKALDVLYRTGPSSDRFSA